VGVDNIIYASEMLGGVNCTNPATGRSFDDNIDLVTPIGWLSAGDKKKIFEENVKKAYPRLAGRPGGK
jgi:hypothetical protein